MLTNDTDPDSAGNGETKTVSGVAAGTVASASGSVAANVTGTYGSITIAANGAYTYTVDNNNATVQALRTSGQTITDVFTYTMTDAAGATSTTQITVTIQGANDAPTAVADTATAVEAGGTSNGTAGTNPTGNVLTNDTDPDSAGNGETKTVSGVAAGTVASASGSVAANVTGAYGSINIAANGAYTYTVDNNNATVQALRTSGQTITDVFTYTMTDAAGATSTTQITVTIQGANDAPTAVADTATAVEAGGTSNGTAGTNPTGNVLTNDTDPDSAGNGETKTVSGVAAGTVASASGSVAANVTGTYGSITIAANGAYTYTVDNNNATVQALRTSGQTITDVFTYTMTDAAGATSTTQITVTIQGANDAPTAVADTATAVEAGGTSNGTAGTNPTGNVLTNDTDPDSAGNGETKTVSGVAAGTVASASGSVAANVTGTYGSINIAANGAYTYTVDNNNNATVQALRTSGQTITDVFTYTMTDAAGATSTTQITVTIQGANDAPTAVADTATAVEAGGMSNGTAGTNPTGNVLTNDTDPDSAGNGETKTVSGVAAGTVASASGSVAANVTGAYGSITIAANGAYTYTVDNNNATVQALANAGQSIQDIFTYTTTDAAGLTHSTQVTVIIQGANDTPTIVSNGGGSTATISIAENITAVTTVVGDDVDAGTTFSYSIIGGADAARFSINSATGSLVFVTAPDYELPSDVGGNNVYDVTIQVSDGSLATTQAIAVTITDVSNFLIVTTATDNNDSGIATGAAYDIEWLNAHTGADASVSLREAIIAANNTAGTDTVNFNISGAGVKTISLASALPAITDAIVINGYSQTGSSANTLAVGNDAVLNVVLDGSSAGAGADGLRLNSGSSGSQIRGLVIDNFAGYGINAQSSGSHTIAGNWIGVDSSGATAAGNVAGGVYLNSSDFNTIGGSTVGDRNVISGNAGNGVTVIGQGSIIQNNYIGTNASGTADMGNAGHGLALYDFGSHTIGGAGSQFRNVISGNDGSGVLISNSGSNTLQGNYIGTNASGTAAIGNSATGVHITANASGNTIGGVAAGAGNLISGNANSGVFIDASNTTIKGNLVGTNAAGTGAIRNGSLGSATAGIFIASGTGSVIGGTSAAERNVLSGNGGAGIWIEGTTGSHAIQGNYIGVDTSGDAALANIRWGIVLNSGAMTNIQIGGTAVGAGNVISGNEASTGGIFIGGNADGTVVEGNRVGIGATTTTALGTVQASGIRVQGSAMNTRIGGIAAGASNVIARNGSVGVTILGNAAGTTIQGNSIYGNNGLAIDLGGNGSTSNDGALTAGQPNQLMDTPVIANANLVGNDLTVAGYVGSAANQSTFANSRVEFYKTTASSSIFLGALTTDASGNFSGTLDVTGLGLSQSDPVIATATHPNGNTSEFSLSFEANAAPTAVADSNTAVEAGGTLNNAAGSNATGNVLANDTDPNSTDTKTVSGVAAGTVASAAGSVGSAVAGNYGSIQIAANGTYTYSVDNNNSAVQALRISGQTLTDIFTYTMRDAGGLTSSTQVTITIQGANDAPVAIGDNGFAAEAGGVANGVAGSNAVGNVLSNDTDVDAGDTKTVSGVAAGTVASANGSVGTSVTGAYGTISLAADGSYTYTVDNSSAAVQALRTSGQLLTDVFSYTVSDTAGLTSTTQLTITISGANDAPTAVTDTATAVEAGGTNNAAAGTNPTGNVLANDIDPDSSFNGESKTIIGVAAGSVATASGSVATSVAGAYGSITISAAGAYSYVVDNSNAAVQALRSSAETLTDVFTYTLTDAGGLTSTAQITVTVQGANDAPVAVNDAGFAVESGGTANGTAGSNATGNVLANDTDMDSGDTQAVHGVVAGVQSSAIGSVGSSVNGSFGSISIAADGSYTYVVDESNVTVQALRTSGQSITDVFTYSVVDTAGLTHVAQLTITIQGANDAPTAVVDSAIAMEAGGANNSTAGVNPTGNLLTNDTDVDSGDSKTVSGIAAGVQLSTSGSVATNVAGAYGSINVAADGSYVYTVDNNNGAVQALRTSGQSLTDVFSYTVTDAGGLSGTTQITITIQGRNDTPTASDDSALADEAGGLNNATTGSNPTGNVLTNDSDVDSSANGETKTISGVAAGSQASATGAVGSNVSGSYGTIAIAADGSYSYTVDNTNAAVQALRTTGQTLADVFTYTMTDAGGLTSSARITVTIRGANDTPIVTADTASATEAGGLGNASVGNDPTGNVLANDSDVDAGDTQTVTGVAAGVQASASGSVGTTVAGAFGSITIAADGSYIYAVDNSNSAVEALRTFADTLTDTFTYTMVDANGAASTGQIVVTIHGQNDAVVAINDSIFAVEAGGLYNGTAGTTPTGNLLSNDTDADAGDSQTVVGVVAGGAGSASGSVGTNVLGAYGALTVAADGTYTYTVDNTSAAVQSLRSTSQTLTDLFTYTVQDGAGAAATATVTVTIQGANDAPIAVTNTASAFEAGGINNNISGSDPTGNVLTNDTDVDAGDSKTVIGVAAGVQASASGAVASSVVGQYGSIVINANGSYVYSLDNNNPTIEALNASSPTLTDTFTYTMVDAAGLTSTTTIVIAIHGADDLPYAVVDMDTAVEAGGLNNSTPGVNASGNVTLNDIQPNGQTIIGVVSGLAASASGSVGNAVAGLYGSVVINSDGTYTYTINDNDPTVQALRLSSDHLTDIFTYTLEDGLGYTSTTQLTITLDGANDTPGAVDDSGVAVEAGGIANATAGSTAAGNVLTNDLDVDSGDTKNVIGVAFGAAASASGSVGASVFGSYGSIVIAVDGTYTYTIDNSSTAVQALRTSSDTLTEVFTYTMEDTAGAASTATITITIQGANDGPMAMADAIDAYEAGGVANATAGLNPSGNVLSNDTDVDATANGETKSVTGVASGVHSSASGFVGSSVAGSYGSISIAADGTYTYTVDNTHASVQALRTASDSLTDVFTYTIQDAAGALSTTQITVTVRGANDTPIAAIDTVDAVEAGGLGNNVAGVNPTGSVLSNDTDVDAGDSLLISGVAAGLQASAAGSVGTVVTGNYGSIVIASDGTYTFTVDNANTAVQALRTVNDTLTDTFTYTVQDASGAVTTSHINLVIRGANDTPVAGADNTVAVEAGGSNNSAAGVNPSGNVLSNDSDFDSSANGETKSVTGVAAGVQSSAAGGVAAPVTGSYGSISIAADGSYSYTVDNSNASVQALRTTGQTLSDVFTYTMIDAAGASSTAQITVTIQGANDNPVAVADTSVAIESGGTFNGTSGVNASGNVLANDTDVDATAGGETKTVTGVASGVVASPAGSVATAVSGAYGAITLNADGTYTYIIDEANATVQALRTAGDQLNDVFSYTVRDAGGLTSTAQVTIVIQGRNDAPVGVNDADTAVEAGGISNGNSGVNPLGNVLINDTDVDAADSKSVSAVAAGAVGTANGNVGAAVAGSYGLVTIHADGSYQYIVDNNNLAVQSLRLTSQTLSDVFTYEVVDTAGLTSLATLTVTIQGANDNPVAATDNGIAIEAGGINNGTSGSNATGNLLLNDTDSDSAANGETKIVSGVASGIVGSASGAIASPVAGSYGSITVSANGSYTYVIDETNASVQALRTDSDRLTDVFTYTVTDAAGLTSTNQVTISIHGRNDTPDDLVATGMTISESSSNGQFVGSVTPSDVDNGDSFTYQLIDDAGGRFAIDSLSGVVSVADSSLLDYESTTSHLVTVRVTDASGASFNKQFTIALTDSNEFSVSQLPM